MARDYYNRRTGNDLPPRLTLAETRRSLAASFQFIEQAGYLQRAFGYYCVDSKDVPGLEGADLRQALLLATGIRIATTVSEFLDDADEVSVFTLIEFLYDHVAKPLKDAGYFHSFSGCGWHYDCHSDKFDQSSARLEWREKVNAFLKFYDDGYELSGTGEIIRIASDGMSDLVQAETPSGVSDTDRAKLKNAVRAFRLARSSREERKQAVRELVDILEFHRDEVKTHLSQDERDLFNIANNFALRHHRAGQKDDYDDVWLDWLFYVYLATAHLVLRRVHGSDDDMPSVPRVLTDKVPF